MSVAYTVSSIAAATSGVAAARWRRANRSRIPASAPGIQTSASSRDPAPQWARTVSAIAARSAAGAISDPRA